MSMLPLISFIQLLSQSGLLVIVFLTVLLVHLLLAAWKAPNWVKEIGQAALASSILIEAIVWIRSISVIIQCNGEISPLLLWNGVASTLCVISYGLIIYIISLILRVMGKPRK